MTSIVCIVLQFLEILFSIILIVNKRILKDKNNNADDNHNDDKKIQFHQDEIRKGETEITTV
jgi:hypothetical protein